MGRLSEEQKKDRKIKIVVGSILLVIIAIVVAVGPGLPMVLDHARENSKEPWAAERYLLIAQIMELTMREQDAQEVYDEMYLKWGGNDWDEDFEEVINESGGNEEYACYFPWIATKYDGYPGVDEDDPDIVNRRPAPMSTTRHALFGKAVIKRAKYWEDERQYHYSRHLYACLFFMWEPGTEEHTEGEKGRRRAAQRSF